jgi:hypothetical protein
LSGKGVLGGGLPAIVAVARLRVILEEVPGICLSKWKGWFIANRASVADIHFPMQARIINLPSYPNDTMMSSRSEMRIATLIL